MKHGAGSMKHGSQSTKQQCLRAEQGIALGGCRGELSTAGATSGCGATRSACCAHTPPHNRHAR